MGFGTGIGTGIDGDRRTMLAATLRRTGGGLRTEVWRLAVSAEPGSFLGGPSLGPVAEGFEEVRRLVLGVADDLDRAAAELESGVGDAAVVCPSGRLR